MFKEITPKKVQEMQEEDISQDYLSGDPLYLESDDKNFDNSGKNISL